MSLPFYYFSYLKQVCCMSLFKRAGGIEPPSTALKAVMLAITPISARIEDSRLFYQQLSFAVAIRRHYPSTIQGFPILPFIPKENVLTNPKQNQRGAVGFNLDIPPTRLLEYRIQDLNLQLLLCKSSTLPVELILHMSQS